MSDIPFYTIFAVGKEWKKSALKNFIFMDAKMIFLFKALSVENESFERDYEIAYDATLLDFHNLIVEDLGFDTMEMASFFTSDQNWTKQHEFTSETMFYGEDETDLDELTPDSMESVLLGQIIKEKHARLLYVFDLLSNRGLYLELINTYQNDSYQIPSVLLSKGEAPLKIDDDNVADEVSEMFDDMYDEDIFDQDDFNEFNGGYDSEYY